MIDGFSAYSGSEFLIFYGALLVAAIVASLFIPMILRPDGRDAHVADEQEAAFLAGGSRRMTEAVLAKLMGNGAVTVTDQRRFVASTPDAGEKPAESALLHKQGDFGMKGAHASISPFAQAVEAGLVAKGLMMDASERSRLRLFAAAPLLLLLGLGGYRAWAGSQEGEPVGFLIGLMVLCVVAIFFRFGKFNRRTRAGERALADLEEENSRLKRAPENAELGFGVAIFGTAVLAGTPYSELHAMRQSAGGGEAGYSSEGDSDSSSDGGGDGGCGGGCGGCGG